jgi:hypothetical protein
MLRCRKSEIQVLIWLQLSAYTLGIIIILYPKAGSEARRQRPEPQGRALPKNSESRAGKSLPRADFISRLSDKHYSYLNGPRSQKGQGKLWKASPHGRGGRKSRCRQVVILLEPRKE